eukprot:TRINITY_DN4747_c0_g2_i2.p1 TRINITY_DN4747_c0_g2~~TRINITY_DN4747_c0_g2_i2.p1  ORF type:complete len:612 (-),score=130.75 TRINITY_DN4747_c0_g2_i2:108-1943(-)
MLTRTAWLVSRRSPSSSVQRWRNHKAENATNGNTYVVSSVQNGKLSISKVDTKSIHTTSIAFAKAAAAAKKSGKDAKSFSDMDIMADGEAEINFEALEMAQQEEEPEFNFADTTALLKIDLPLTLPQFIALLIKTISTLTPEELKHANQIRHLLSIPRPLADTFATRDKTVSETLRAGNPTLREFTDEELFNEIQERVKCFNTLIDALPTRDNDRRALRALIETEDTVSLRQFMETDLGLGGRSRILRPVLYESRPTEVTKEALYISTETPANEIFTSKNVGKYLRLTDRDLAKFLPEGMGGHIQAREFQSTQDKALLIRQAVIDAIQQLQKAEQNAFARSLAPAPPLFVGEKGSGKSAALAQVVLWARKSGWLVLYMPSGMDVTAGGDFIEKSSRKGETTIWDDPSTSFKILNNFLTAHAEKLKEVPIKTKFTLGKLQATTLFDLVEYGAALPQFSAAAYHHLRAELARVTEFPVLLACDDYNMYYDFSRHFADPESPAFKKEMLPARQLAIVDSLYDCHVNPRLAFGTFIGATSQTQGMRPFLAANESAEAKKGWIEVKPYSRAEFDHVISHYQFTNWVRAELPVNSREYIYQLTSGVGSDFWTYSQKL